MNQIIDYINNNSVNSNKISNNVQIEKENKKYKILFIIFSFFAMISIFLLMHHLYKNRENSIISKKLTDSYSISTLYANTVSYTAETQNAIPQQPFVIGIIQIDKINLNYSILSSSSDELLNLSVCRFAGPMPNEIGNLCIAGHNYINNDFFGQIDELNYGDIIKIYDLNGNVIEYEIYKTYQTNEDDTSCTFQDTNNLKIVTLITCNNINGKRYVVHAKEVPQK